jgi:hypothetical protein
MFDMLVAENLVDLEARETRAPWRGPCGGAVPLISLARTSWEALPLSVRAVLLMVTGCLLFSIMGAISALGASVVADAA